MKIQYEDKDLVMKLIGEFHIIDVKNYGLRLINSLQTITQLLTKSMNWLVIKINQN